VTRIAATLVVLWSLGPFLWFSLVSIKGPEEVSRRPPTLVPERPTLEGYRLAAGEGLLRWMRNSAVVSAATTLLAIPLAAMAAYALSRTRLRGRRAILGLLLAVSMFPQVTLAPVLYQMLNRMGLVNTLVGPVVPTVTLSLPLSIWLLASFFREIPQELEEAARLDGAGPIRTLFRVFLPVAAPGLATAALLVFIQSWNEFFFALILLTRNELKTLPVGIATMPGQYTFPWGEVAAASVTATAPLLVAALVFQKKILSGLTAGAVKG
jgi:multiple sugar transport system permease protein